MSKLKATIRVKRDGKTYSVKQDGYGLVDVTPACDEILFYNILGFLESEGLISAETVRASLRMGTIDLELGTTGEMPQDEYGTMTFTPKMIKDMTRTGHEETISLKLFQLPKPLTLTGAELSFAPEFLSADEATRLLKALRTDTPWKNFKGGFGQLRPRLTSNS